MAAAHRHRRGNELILVAGRARIGDGIQLGVTADADHRISAGYGKEPFRSGSVGPAALSGRDAAVDGSATESRCGSTGCATPGTWVRWITSEGAAEAIGAIAGAAVACTGAASRCSPVQPLLHAFQRLAHGGHLAPQCLRILCITLLSVRRRDRQCPQACQTQYGQTHCILP